MWRLEYVSDVTSYNRFTTCVRKVDFTSSVLHLTFGVGLPVTTHSKVRFPPSWTVCLDLETIVTSGRPESSGGDNVSTQRRARVAPVMKTTCNLWRFFFFCFLFLAILRNRALKLTHMFPGNRMFPLWAIKATMLLPAFHCTCLMTASIWLFLLFILKLIGKRLFSIPSII